MITLTVDTGRLASRLGAMQGRVRDAASAEIDSLIGELEARIADKLNGGVLQSRSGVLANSIGATNDSSAASLKASLGVSADVKYAAIQEYGGTTPAHDILATKGKALAFVTGGGTVYAAIVHHPGSRIPSRSYMRASLDEMKDSVTAGLKTAVVAGLRS
jgi:phage gpG-like protein